MLKVAKQQTVSLDACGSGVMLSISDGEGHVFRQALDAHDAGKLLELISLWGVDERVLCQGDLVAKISPCLHELYFTWHDEREGNGFVQLDRSDRMVFEEALRSYCRLLMRSPEDLP